MYFFTKLLDIIIVIILVNNYIHRNNTENHCTVNLMKPPRGKVNRIRPENPRLTNLLGTSHVASQIMR